MFGSLGPGGIRHTDGWVFTNKKNDMSTASCNQCNTYVPELYWITVREPLQKKSHILMVKTMVSYLLLSTQ